MVLGLFKTINPMKVSYLHDWDIHSVVVYIDLQKNPEGYTGFSGPHAWRIWDAMYGENCFHESLETLCLEQRMFYRLLSGLHGCISAHIASNYPLKNGEYGMNSIVFQKALGDHPERVDNVYFTYVILLRALNKISNVLSEFEFDTGNIIEDKKTKDLFDLVMSSGIIKDCSSEMSFDETLLFQDPSTVRIVLSSSYPLESSKRSI